MPSADKVSPSKRTLCSSSSSVEIKSKLTCSMCARYALGRGRMRGAGRRPGCFHGQSRALDAPGRLRELGAPNSRRSSTVPVGEGWQQNNSARRSIPNEGRGGDRSGVTLPGNPGRKAAPASWELPTGGRPSAFGRAGGFPKRAGAPSTAEQVELSSRRPENRRPNDASSRGTVEAHDRCPNLARLAGQVGETPSPGNTSTPTGMTSRS